LTIIKVMKKHGTKHIKTNTLDASGQNSFKPIDIRSSITYVNGIVCFFYRAVLPCIVVNSFDYIVFDTRIYSGIQTIISGARKIR
ncbi:MAG: hypothetical protein NC350_06360, partial [Corallococcus sp.]|nr:hypothetical protein [Corallococcus sp.]